MPFMRSLILCIRCSVYVHHKRRVSILGVTFDPTFTFWHHVDFIVIRALSRFNVLQALAGTNWDRQNKTILIAYKSLILSIFMYAAHIWFPNASPSMIQGLQTVQNSALRVVTGCVNMTSIDHLHEKIKVLFVHDQWSPFLYFLRISCQNHLI